MLVQIIRWGMLHLQLEIDNVRRFCFRHSSFVLRKWFNIYVTFLFNFYWDCQNF